MDDANRTTIGECRTYEIKQWPSLLRESTLVTAGAEQTDVQQIDPGSTMCHGRPPDL